MTPAFALLPLAAAAAAADSLPAYVADPIEVRADAAGTPAPMPLTVTRLTRAEIDRRPGGTLAQLLEGAAGLRVMSRGLDGSEARVGIRGSSAEQVVFLVDGRRVGDAQGGGFDASTIPLDAVESVDVARGGASALWGADALGGAVLVRTRPPRPGARVRVAGGSFGERAASVQLGALASGHWALRGAARAWRSDGTYPYEDDETGERGVTHNGDSRTASGEVRAEGDLGGWRARLDAAGRAGTRGVPGSEEFPTPSARLHDERASAGLLLEAPGGTWHPSLDVSGAWQSRRYREPDAAFGALDDRHRNARVRAELAVSRAVARGAVLVAAGAATDRLRSTTDGSRRRDAADARVQAHREVRLATRPLRLLAAARWDGVDGDAPFLSPRLGASTELGGGVLVSVSGGTSFRPPSFDELFWPPRATAAGNPDLRAERGRDADVSIAWSPPSRGFRVAASGFARVVDDLIQWIPGADGVWRPHNLARARVAGVELESAAGLPVGRRTLRIAVQGSRLSAVDRSGEPNADGRTLPYRPAWTAAAAAVLDDVVGGEAEVRVHALADVFVTRANTKRLPGRTTVDLAWRRPIGAGLAVDATVENVADVAARDFRDYPLPGRAVTLGLSWKGGAS